MKRRGEDHRLRLRVLDAAVSFQEALTSMESKAEAETAAVAAAPWQGKPLKSFIHSPNFGWFHLSYKL